MLKTSFYKNSMDPNKPVVGAVSIATFTISTTVIASIVGMLITTGKTRSH
jgi:hypothetical protein